MEVRIKYELVSRSTISSISFNHQFGVLSVVADGNDTAAFFSMEPNELGLTNKFGGQSKPSSSGYVSWSPNGLLIAVANVKVELWKFEAMKLAPLRIINQGFIEIKNIGWSQDSKHYLCYGVNPKDNPLSVNIRQIQSNELRQIITEDPPILANFDPFGKYIVVLTLRNCLDVYDFHTLDKIKSINFAETKLDLPTLKDRRSGDWSPEYSYFACPNLNDARVPTALILDRNKGFSVKQILIGHQATVSCTKFNPHIFEHESDKTFILAVGDSSGCVSVWRIGKNKSSKQPLFIISSPNKAEESVEGVEWNSEGNLLVVNVLKKYVMLVSFRLEDFGRKLSEYQKSNLIVSTYGVSGANEIAGARLEVFGQQDQTMIQQNKLIQPAIVNYENNFGVQDKPRERLIKTQQEVIIKKGEKKRIIPSMYVPESQITRKAQANTSTSQAVPLNSQNRVWEKPKLPSLNLPIMKQEIKRQYVLRDHILQVENSKNVTILTTKQRSWRSANEAESKRFFNGQLKLIHVTHSDVLVIANDKLFVFDFNLKLIQLPCFLGNISHFAANNSGTVYYMTTNGFIRGFNYIRHESICETSAAYLLLSESSEITSNPFSMFLVFDDDCDKLHVELKNSLDRYFFCKESNSWIQFDFDQGFYLPGHSLRITKTDVQTASNFYNNLVAPALLLKNRQNESAVSEYELQVLYYGKYSKDTNKFKDALVKMFADLKAKGNDDQLRKEINKYFIDTASSSYLSDRDLWSKVARIGGKVIQQFLMLQKF